MGEINKQCSIQGCAVRHHARGYCKTHYTRTMRHGCASPDGLIPHRTGWPVRERFMSYVAPIPEAGCWLWLGCINQAGYGRFFFNGKMHLAHRAARSLFLNESIGSDLVLHKCDVPSCVNPNHTYIGNQLDNMRDCIDRGRFVFGEAHANAKLKLRQAKAIKASNAHPAELARLYGVSETLVRQIRQGSRWGHI